MSDNIHSILSVYDKKIYDEMLEGICGFEWGTIEYYRRLRIYFV